MINIQKFNGHRLLRKATFNRKKNIRATLSWGESLSIPPEIVQLLEFSKYQRVINFFKKMENSLSFLRM